MNTEPSSNVCLSHHQLNSISNTRFPNIELPKFHGEYEKWGQFRDMFLALVDRDPTLDNVKKFYYLMSCLKGEAARVIENMEVTGENYDHVRELVEMPSVTRDPNSLRKLTDDLQKHLRSLTSLGEPVTQWSSRAQNTSVNHKKPVSLNRTFSGAAIEASCVYCNGQHAIYLSDKFKALPAASLRQEIQKLKLCWNCLRQGHQKGECRSRGCKRCGARHNTLLLESSHHNAVPASTSSATESALLASSESAATSGVAIAKGSSSAVQKNDDQSTGLLTGSCVDLKNRVLLSTAIILLKDAEGRWHECRALLDSGSQPNFITKRTMELLKLKPMNRRIPVLGVGSSIPKACQVVSTEIRSTCTTFSTKQTLLVLEKITENQPSIQLGPGLPVLHNTVLVWIISEKLEQEKSDSTVVCSLAVSSRLESQIEKFWPVEEVSRHKTEIPEHGECETLFRKTTRRDERGHFVVTLPIKNNVTQLDCNLHNAITRLHAIEQKFSKNPSFREEYVAFMKEYVSLGHMSRIAETDITPSIGNTFYLPHHGVSNPASTTTKFRVVFDGSSKSNSGLSLNDTLSIGPKIQQDLFDILVRFRKYSVVLVADIAKMYRQVGVEEGQRDLQRIVWRENTSEDITHYKLNTITYGTASASFLAVRCLQQVGQDNLEKYPKTSKVILNDLYVDDLISGSDSVDDAKQLKNELAAILDSYGFPLRKWLSNRVEALEQTVNNESNTFQLNNDETHKTLGVFWKAENDVFKYTVEIDQFVLKRITKRDVSKTVIYDFLYNFLKHQYSDKVSLAYTDTDSLIVHAEADNFYEDMKSHMHYFDTSNYDADNPHNMPRTASELGKMKGKVLSAFYGTGLKAYCIDAVDQVA
ncbi:unnamed protein product [Acanthoscelides obtectus]|uniref:CCHC-type domain-containing protein n=1 Tax=Acanthoscelides obtectus TaxID=200917 RepID=A0A9P0PMV1_ACAOB|nr:unnamed protein product [Acanthoscelides obtectus]CAK1680853.1 hypothetical protein AOBTE_LOCUS32909 [Acanthoscelides obtectus]